MQSTHQEPRPQRLVSILQSCTALEKTWVCISERGIFPPIEPLDEMLRGLPLSKRMELSRPVLTIAELYDMARRETRCVEDIGHLAILAKEVEAGVWRAIFGTEHVVRPESIRPA